jgi:pilus assembly protein CpaB
MISAKPNGWAIQRTVIRFAMAGGLAIVALVVTQGWVESRAAARNPAIDTVEVLVAAHAIEVGTAIAAEDLRWQAWPAELVGRDWMRRQHRLKARAVPDISGRVVQAQIAAGVPITASMLVAPGTGSEFAALIRPGWRAISISVTPAAGLAGFVEPGDRVDVLLTQTLGNRRTAQTLMGDIGVLGVDQHRRGGGGNRPMDSVSDVIADANAQMGAAPPDLVTLEVTPRQAEALAVALELGKLSLVLRGPTREPIVLGGRRWDSDVTGLSATLFEEDRNGGMQAAAAPPAVLQGEAQMRTAPVAAPRNKIEVVYGLPVTDVAAAAP